MAYLASVLKQFEYYKNLADSTFVQLNDQQLFWLSHEDSNSIALIVQHLAGNMLSRWTNFLTEDGEKSWRNRDEEFELQYHNRDELLTYWESGWDCLFGVLRGLKESDLDRIIYIRNQGHTVLEAINRQLAHYPYHVGQIVVLGKMQAGSNWKSLSIPKGKSQTYNQEKFAQKPHREHFTDEVLKPKS
ncbi:DUF1572 family protein [Sphingobacterium spiritivorum]|uniref:DUF1572 family protein n=1 Tax=Sphingobacterium spiritivorum TaxID=258 RepID=UPI003DA521ED